MLNKKALRKFADTTPAPAIPANHGLLHAPQVDYIVRTDVKIIDRRRTLVLYVYDRKRAADGGSAPVWTVFQAGGDYITLARKEDGSTHWRSASFERLGNDYFFTDKCTFYSAQDEQRVRDFFHDRDHGGIAALVRAQTAILNKRSTERQRRRERRTIDRMRPLHALPRDLDGWVRRSVMPAYFRCEHASSRRAVTGICTSCGKEATLPNAAHNSKVICPRCKRELTVKSIGKMGRHFDRDTVQVIEKISSNEVVARIVKVYYNYDRDCMTPKENVYENARIFMRCDPDGKVVIEPYYYSCKKGTLTHWMPGERPVFFTYNYNFEADICGHVYCRNLSGALAGTPWEYCPVTAFYEHFREPMQMAPFLQAHLEHPRLEHLVKVGFFNLASDLAYGRIWNRTLDEAQERTHRLLGVDAGDVAFLRELDVSVGTLQVFQSYAGLKDRQRLLRWQLDHNVTRNIDYVLKHITPHKFMRYIDEQYAALRLGDAKERYGNVQSVVSEYRDYLDMCQKQHYDLKNSFVLFPRDLQKSHDRLAERIKIKADMKMREEFLAAYKRIKGQLDFEQNGMKIVYPASLDEIVAEGQALHHCVGNYVDRVAAKKTMILFLRRSEDVEKPFYTVEVLHGKVSQVRGAGNCDATPEVSAFMSQWERQVLRARAAAA